MHIHFYLVNFEDKERKETDIPVFLQAFSCDELLTSWEGEKKHAVGSYTLDPLRDKCCLVVIYFSLAINFLINHAVIIIATWDDLFFAQRVDIADAGYCIYFEDRHHMQYLLASPTCCHVTVTKRLYSRGGKDKSLPLWVEQPGALNPGRSLSVTLQSAKGKTGRG